MSLGMGRFFIMLTNKRGWDVAETFQRVDERQQKFSQQEANYQPVVTSDVCGICRFYLRDERSEVGRCQVVDGEINWFGTSDLYISAEEEARVSLAGENAYEGEDMDKETTEEKALLIGMEGETIPISVTSFTDLDAMHQAQDMVDDMKSVTMQFAEMSENIFLNDEIADKAGALQTLATEFSERVSNPVENKESSVLTKEQEVHYKEVEADNSKALDIDFQGGCDSCDFGTDEIIKLLDKCPFCWN